MGNREALLQAAKACLLEKGYSRTTARDLAAGAGVSLAAIGYHFRSKEALLTEAMLLAFEDWHRHFRSLLVNVPPGTRPAERFQSIWTRLIETFETHRPLWRANYEIFSQLGERPEIGEALGASVPLIRRMLAALFLGVSENDVPEAAAREMGAFYHTLLSGMIGQWLLDPTHAPTAEQLTQALRVVGGSFAAEIPEENQKAKRNPG